MRFEQYLQEKYMGSKKSRYSMLRNKIYSIYMNPTKTELKFAIEESPDEEIRFMADNLNKKVFVWSSDLLHSEVWDDFLSKTFGKGRSTRFEMVSGLLPGNAHKIGNTYKMICSDQMEDFTMEPEWAKDILEIDWKWADKYIKVTPWLKKFKQKYKTD